MNRKKASPETFQKYLNYVDKMMKSKLSPSLIFSKILNYKTKLGITFKVRKHR